LTRSARLKLGLLCCIAGFLAGCGSSGSDVQLRFMLASPDAPMVNVLIDGTSVVTNLGYGNASVYISVRPGLRHIQLAPVSGSAPIFSQSLSFNSTNDQTLLFTGPAASIQPVVLTDGGTTTTTVTGEGYVRVINASAAMGPADVYIVPAGASIVGIKPVAASLAFDKNTGYQLTVAGNYEVFMTVPNHATALLSTGPISLTSAQDHTVVALDGTSGGYFFTPLIDQ